MIYDHYPLKLELNVKRPTLSKKEWVLNRGKCFDPKVQKNFLDFNFSCLDASLTPPECFTSFRREIRALMISSNILSKNRISDPKRVYSNVIMRLLKHRSETRNADERRTLTNALRIEIASFKRESYERYIRKGSSFLKQANHHEAWKWVKSNCGGKQNGDPRLAISRQEQQPLLLMQ